MDKFPLDKILSVSLEEYIDYHSISDIADYNVFAVHASGGDGHIQSAIENLQIPEDAEIVVSLEIYPARYPGQSAYVCGIALIPIKN